MIENLPGRDQENYGLLPFARWAAKWRHRGAPSHNPVAVTRAPQSFPIWRPIATAPRGGTDILLYQGPSGDPIWGIGYWHTTPDGKRGWQLWGIDPDVYDWPTHWMPLPEPPKP